MTNREVLQFDSFNKMKPYMGQLKEAYEELSGQRVCLSCGGEIISMITFLKKHYMETQFELARPFAIYKLQKGSPHTISNSKMTDELALEFLRLNPHALYVFKRYPENIEELLEGNQSPVSTDPEDTQDDELTAEILNKITMPKLKEAYPDIKSTFGMKKVELIEAILESLK